MDVVLHTNQTTVQSMQPFGNNCAEDARNPRNDIWKAFWSPWLLYIFGNSSNFLFPQFQLNFLDNFWIISYFVIFYLEFLKFLHYALESTVPKVPQLLQ